jgi:L-lactate dehydrogenase complex protein LldG
MSHGNPSEDRYGQFASVAETYGVSTQRVTPQGLTAAIDSVIDPPAVGTQLPFEGVSFPESVTVDPTVAQLREATTGVTPAAGAVASYGTLLLRTDEFGSEPVSLFNDLHVAILDEDDILPDMTAAFEWLGGELRETPDSAVLATGPSATADMGALVQGAHGPKDVEVLVVT